MVVWVIFKGRGTGSTAIRIGDLGSNHPHEQGPGGVSDPGGETTDPAEDTVWEVEIHLNGNGKGGGGVLEDGGMHQAELEHSCTVHRYAITVRPVWGVGKGTWGATRYAVVGTGGN